MDNSMAWIEYNQVYKQHLRGAMAANSANLHPNAHHYPASSASAASATPHHHHAAHHSAHQGHSLGAGPMSHHGANHPSHYPYTQHGTGAGGANNMMAATHHHYERHNPMTVSNRSAASTPVPAAAATTTNVMQSTQHSQFMQHQSMACSTYSMFTGDPSSTTQYPSHRTTQSQSGSTITGDTTIPESLSNCLSKQFPTSSPSPAASAAASTLPYSHNSHSKTANGSVGGAGSKSAKHSSTSTQSSASLAASSLSSSTSNTPVNSSFDSSCYYRSSKDAYHGGSNPAAAWSILNSCTQSTPLAGGGVGNSVSNCNGASASIHHANLANQTKCPDASASSSTSSSRLSSTNTPNAASMAASFNSSFDQYAEQRTPNHLNGLMNQSTWNQHHHHSAKQRYDGTVHPSGRPSKQQSSSMTSEQLSHEQPQQQQQQHHRQSSSTASQQQQQHHQSGQQQHHPAQHVTQQFGANSDISSASSSCALASSRYPSSTEPNGYLGTNYSDYSALGASADIFHSMAWQQNYAMAKATYQQQYAANEAMFRQQSAQGGCAPGSANNSSKPVPPNTGAYPPANYGQSTPQASHHHFAGGTASPYFPSIVPDFPAVSKFHRQTNRMYFAAMAAEMQHKQMQQHQHQSRHSALQHDEQNFYHSQNQNHLSQKSASNLVQDPYSGSMMDENHTQQLMNYSNSFFPAEQTSQSQSEQQQQHSVSTPATKTKKRPTRRTKANAAAIAAQQQQQAASAVVPEYQYSNYSQCNGNLSQQTLIQQQQQQQRSLSRCSSVSSQHHQPQHQHRTSESSNSHYNNYSPATTTGHSPYHTGGSSQTPCLGGTPGQNSSSVNGTDSGYYTGGTVFPNQAPTPTPGGYPTPPSSVGQNSNPRCNSNGELSPYSSNSMSSTMSQSYTNPGSSKTSNSQISPVHSHDNVEPAQYQSSCMMQKADEAFYQSQQATFADTTPYTDNGPVQAVTNQNELYLDYVNPEQTVNDPNYAQYDNAHYDTTEAYPEPEMELSSCSKMPAAATVTVNPSPKGTMNAIAEPDDYHQQQQTQIQAQPQTNEHHTESFNLNFDSVIPIIDDALVRNATTGADGANAALSKVQSDIHSSVGDNIPSVDALLPSIDDINHHFIEHQQPQPLTPSPQSSEQQQQSVQQTQISVNSNLEYSHNLLSNDSSSQQQQQQQQHLQNTSILDDDEPMVECSQIHSIIDSLPDSDSVLEASVNADVNPDTINGSANNNNTATANMHSTSVDCTSTVQLPSISSLQNTAVSATDKTVPSHDQTVDEYPSDLAPLLADSSKIALMESTFKSPADVDELPKLDDDDDDDVVDGTNGQRCDDNQDDDDEEEDSKLKDLEEFLISEGVQESIDNCEPIVQQNSLQRENNVPQNIPNENVVVSQQQQLPATIVQPSNNNQIDSTNAPKSTTTKKSSKRKSFEDDDSKTNDNNQKLPAISMISSTTVPTTNTTTGTSTNDLNPNKKRKVAVVHPKSKETKKEIKIEFVEPIKEKKSVTTNSNTKSKDKTKSEHKTSSKEWLKDKKQMKKLIISEIITNKLENGNHVEKKKSKLIEKVKISSSNKKTKSTSTGTPKSSDLKSSEASNKNSINSRIQESKENVSKPNLNSVSLKPKITNKKIIPKIEISPMPTIPVMLKPSVPGTIIDINYPSKKLPKPKQISPKPKKVPVKEIAISPKPAAGALFNNNGTSNKPQTISLQRPQSVLSPVGTSLTVPSQPTKAKTPPVSFGAPTTTQTLIVNQNGPQSYQMQPMTNASPMMLISIHPTLHPSAAASSTFILNTQNSLQSTNTTQNGQVNNGTSLTPQSSVSRRKSQDKKLTTIREGMMRTGDFVVAEDEAQLSNPVIWRIEGKSLLQRFESTDQNGQTVYVNTSSYSAWNPTVREKYLGLDVRILGCNRSRTVVEKIGLTSAKKSESNVAIPEKESAENSSDNSSTLNGSADARQQQREDLSIYFDNFEVYVQTLVSQALDPNFIAEIIKENDDYFISHMNAIDDLCIERKTKFLAKQKWDSNLVKCIDLYPKNQIHQQSDVGDLRCRLCHDNWSTKILQFEGDVYNLKTLEIQESTSLDLKQTKLALCDSCTDKAFLYSKMQHQKYNFYINCKTKVQNIISQDENKDSREILDECLGDTDWIKELFSELESMLVSCERYSK